MASPRPSSSSLLLSRSTIRKLYHHIPHGRLRPSQLADYMCPACFRRWSNCSPPHRRRANFVLLVNNISLITIIILIALINSSDCLQDTPTTSFVISHHQQPPPPSSKQQQQNNTAPTTPTQPCISIQNSSKNQHHHPQYPPNQLTHQQHLNSTELICPPVILNQENELIVGAGSNVTLACSARGAGPLTFVWFQDEKNLVGRNSTAANANANNPSDPPPSTKLLEEKRYEIAEESGPNNVTTSILYLMNLKLTDSSLFLCWVENAAGYALGNFSLIVNDSPPAHLGGGAGCGADGLSSSSSSSSFSCGLTRLDTRATQVAIVIVGFILLLVAAIICLVMLRQVLASRRRQSTKSSSQSDLKSQQANDKLSKSSPAHMFASSDEDGATEEDEDDDQNSSAGSSASCRKTGKDLDDFIERMRSGIINMDYHTMSPVNQFNNPLKQQQQQQQQTQQPQHRQQQQDYYQPSHELQMQQQQQQLQLQQNFQPMAHMNHHFPTLSNLSPSSGGSASTSFATNPNPPSLMTNFIPHQQQQFLAAANMAAVLQSDDTLRHNQYIVHPMANYLPYPAQQHPYQYHG